MRRSKRRWIGIDGEGIGRDPHRYVQLACSDGDYIERKQGLRTADCLEFLINLGTRDARVCGYYLSYDWTMILRELPDADLYALLRPELRTRPREEGGGFNRIEWGPYTLHYLAGAMWITRGSRRVTIWDLGKFYQGPFVDALKDWNIAPHVQDQIAAMKKKRDVFEWRDHEKILAYCLDECRALAELAEAMEQAHKDAGIRMRSWHGPGSTAGSLLKRESIDDQLGPPLHPLVRFASAVAYAGGRAEIGRNGWVEQPVDELDLTSAYPAQALKLPCLLHGRWSRVTAERHVRSASVALCCGDIVNVKAHWGPLPVRLKNGSMVYPLSGARGYWHKEEWLLARSAFKGLSFDHAYIYHTDCDCKPFGFIQEMFDHRLAIGKKTGAGRIIKLALNSIYGKLAQILAATFGSRLWAGMITSGTRAELLRKMLECRRLENVLMAATDGLYVTEKLSVPDQPHLGGWERESLSYGMTLIRPGIYWTPDGKLRARGVGRDNASAARDIFEHGISFGVDRVRLPDRTVFGAARAFVAQPRPGVYKRSRHYGQWFPIPTNIDLRPSPKRLPDWRPPSLNAIVSAPYNPSKRPLNEILEELQGLTL